MKPQTKKLLICLTIPLAVGGLGALLSGGMSAYPQLNRPPLSPPGWVFPLVWTILYLMMGYASYRICRADALPPIRKGALGFYGAQLFLNFLWPILFFGFRWYWPAFILLVLLWATLFLTMHLFSRIDETAENLLIPYLLWVTFAGYLNLGIALMN